jgi:hypothetical protein
MVILITLDRVMETSVTARVWQLWAISGVGILAGVALWVAADKSSGGGVGLKAVGVLVIALTSLVPLVVVVRGLRQAQSMAEPAEEVPA